MTSIKCRWKGSQKSKQPKKFGMQNLSSRHFLSLNQAFFQSSFSVVPKKRSQKLMKKTLEESAPPRPKSATFNFYQFLLGLFKDVINKMSDGGISSMVRDIITFWKISVKLSRCSSFFKAPNRVKVLVLRSEDFESGQQKPAVEKESPFYTFCSQTTLHGWNYLGINEVKSDSKCLAKFWGAHFS